MAKDFDKELERMILENEQKMELIEGEYDTAFDQSFADHEAATEAAERMSKNEGENALYEKLRMHPDSLGKMPEGAAAFDRAIDQRRLLPGLFAEYRALRDRTDALRRTQENRAKDAGNSGPQIPPSNTSHEAGGAAERRRLQEAQKDWKLKKAAQPTSEHQSDLEWEPD